MAFSSPSVVIGDRVRVRRQRWVVTNVDRFDACALVTLSGQSDTNLGLERQVLTPFEPVDPMPSRRGPHKVCSATWRHACRALLANDGPSDALRTATAARIDILPHQLEPALAVARGAGCRVLIADEVGLGKTIQAALIVAELRARGAATRVLVLTPAGLRDQWTGELAQRFQQRFTTFDMRAVARARAYQAVGVNPWTAEALVIASLDYVKRPDVLPAVRAARWDLIVVDEAHHGTTGTDRHDALSILCGAAAYVVLLTATPHSGDTAAFSALCAIGRHDDPLLLFRRTRGEVGLWRPRHVHQLHVSLTRAERHMHACLAAFARRVLREQMDGGAINEGRDLRLAVATLHKRALSSAHALERSVRRRLEALERAPLGTPDPDADQLPLPLDEDAGELEGADASPAWMIPALRDPRQERILLERVADAAREASEHESKLSALTRLLRRTREPVLIFTEYRDTLLHVQHTVAPDAAIIHGGLSREERRTALARFPGTRLLLATDAAGEGLNLQGACRTVVNLELPWNPMRLEQRIGRVDRIGQRRPVHVFHLIAGGTGETRMLRRLEARIAAAQDAVGAPDPLSSSTDPRQERGLGVERVSDTVVVPRLHADAVEETRRLTFARALLNGRGRPTLPGKTIALPGETLVAFAKTRRMRRQLRGRMLVVFQSCLGDANGQCIASRAIAVLASEPRDRTDLAARLDRLAGYLDERNRSLGLDAQDRGTSHEAFWNARRTRELAIIRWLAQSVRLEHQRGLFDRRADRALDEAVARIEGARTESERRLRAIDRRLDLKAHPPSPILILLPRPC